MLVDEAHNLVPRARDMYSATLDPAVFEAARAGGLQQGATGARIWLRRGVERRVRGSPG